MSLRNPAARGKPDANQEQIGEAYRACGCSVVDTHTLGFGFPDLVVGLVGVTELIEVKTEDGDLEPAQRTFAGQWRGSRVRVIRTVDEVLEHVKSIRRRAWGTT